MRKLFKLNVLAFMALFSLFLSSCNDDDENVVDEEMFTEFNIVESAQATGDLSSLVAALIKADLSANNDLVNTLSSTNTEFTVFAPSNQAFADLLSRLDGYDSLEDFDTVAEQDLLASILAYHVVAGASVRSGDLTDGQSVPTVQGESLTVSTDGGVFFEDAAGELAQVTTADVETANGIVHIIDKVLLPQEAIDALNGVLLFSITDLAISNPNLSSLVAALIAADGDLPNVLKGAGPFTVLAPTDEAFATFLNGSALSDIPTPVLTQVLLNHVISGNISSEALIALGSGYRSTLADGPVADSKISIYFDTDNGVEFNGVSTVSAPDVKAINGVVHVVDAVIGLPNIVDHALANSNLNELVGALTAGGNTTFTTLLSSTDESFTVFAPVNSAFADFTNPDNNEINNILSNHVIVGTAALSSSLMNMYVKTAATNADDDALSMYINTDDGVVLNGESKVAIADIVAANGIIHAVDKVIDLPTVVDFAVADAENFSSLVGALTADGQPDFVGTLSTPNGTSPAPFTVFAPLNSAFEALTTVPSGEDLTAVLQHHVITGANIVSGDLSDGLVSPATLEGDTLTFSITGEAVSITDGAGNSDINIAVANVQAINGVIHAIDKVMIPDTSN
jgi:transforming growth factor-beta-induced protein